MCVVEKIGGNSLWGLRTKKGSRVNFQLGYCVILNIQGEKLSRSYQKVLRLWPYKNIIIAADILQKNIFE